MKITFVTDTYTPQANGVATTLERLVNGLRERGHQVDVVRPAVLACDEEGLKVPSFGLPGYREVRFGFPMRIVLQSRWSRRQPDVIYVATETPLGASAITAARALGIPAASGFHTNFQQYVAHYRMPLLEKATRIEVVSIAGPRTAYKELPGFNITRHLSRHGLNAELKRLPLSGDVGDTLLSYAADAGSDYLIMGGYGHSRLREFVLGGTTRTIMTTLTLPVLMSH
jgi:nucleotide-binding universal stress UspA family protein